MIARPDPSEFTPFYAGYVDAVDGDDALGVLTRQPDEWDALLGSLDADHAYAPGKWTVREVAQHVADTERVFAYRALRWARGDRTELPGFDQDDWIPHDPGQSLAQLTDEIRAIRAATLALARPLSPEALGRGGLASGNHMTVRAAIWVIAGHTAHHARILRERYAG
ncbi:MAG: DinB family protein [Bacteroidota bacterium]